MWKILGPNVFHIQMPLSNLSIAGVNWLLLKWIIAWTLKVMVVQFWSWDGNILFSLLIRFIQITSKLFCTYLDPNRTCYIFCVEFPMHAWSEQCLSILNFSPIISTVIFKHILFHIFKLLHYYMKLIFYRLGLQWVICV